MRALSVSFLFLFASCATLSCAAADPDAVKGGASREGYDAAAPPPLDAGVTEQTDKDAPPTSWRGIYRDFFGRAARSGCAGNGTCHESVGQTGVSVGAFLCADADSCWQSLRSKSPDTKLQSGLVLDSDVADPNGAHLFEVIRIRQSDGTVAKNLNMPQLPVDFAYSQEDVDRMKTWIKNGANKD